MSSISDRLPFWHFDEHLMVFSDGSLGAGFRLSGFDISCLPASDINGFTRKLENLLVSCESGTRLQIFYRLTSDVNELVNQHEIESREAAPEYKDVADARSLFIKGNLRSKNYYVPEIYLFVRSSRIQYRKQKLFEKDESFKILGKKEYQEGKEKFLRALRQIESSLFSARLNPQQLDSQEWFTLLFQYLNFSRSEKIGNSQLRKSNDPFGEVLNKQVAQSDIYANKDGVSIGDYLFKVITLNLLPEGSTYSSIIDEFTKMPFHFWISQNIQILDQSKERGKLQFQRRIAHSMASGSQNVSDIESESKLAHIEELLTELLEGSEKLHSMDFNIIIWDKDANKLDEKVDEVLKAFRSMNQAEGLVETLPALDAFIKAMPGVCEGLRHRKMKSSNIAHFMPVYSYWHGNSRPVCLLPNREGGLFALDPFAKELPNWNGIVFGGSGAGKSFTVCQLMLMFCGQTPRPRIIWIDNGASSKRLIEVMNGEFMDLKLDSGICLNMFDLPKGENAPSPAKVKLILAVLELMLKDEERKGLPKREKALLEEAIYKTYKSVNGEIPTLSNLKELLAKHEVSEMKKYAEVLYSWTGSTAYGKLLDGQSNVKLSKDLVTIEVQSLNAHSELKDVLLLLLTSYIQDMSSGDFERPYLLVVDEAERLFQTEMAKQFVITCYRTWRKFNSGIWSLSQNYKDFLADKNLADSLMPNTTSVFILRQRKIDWKDFQETFDFNEAQVDAIKSLEIVKGKYSEFYYLQDESQTVLRLVPEPLSYWICTSDGNDKARIVEMEKKFPELSKIEILKKLAFSQKEVA
ncbi:MAG: TraC family protein [Halobacteriovoraceae bacterium]|nr:TraC family protein [Halobacteriovoraceae bacterium]MCB9093437.1 TraC family protein [Halobacteriovoraceae bacterium]